MKIVAIIQARMGSSRLSGKVLADIAGAPMLARVIERVRRAQCVDQVMVATSNQPADAAIAEYCSANGVACFRGSETDVLDRFHQAAKDVQADGVVRITGDCPLIDPTVIDKVVERFTADGVDYASNVLRYTYPDGLDAEAFSFAALERAARTATLPADREHVTLFIRNAPDFTRTNVEHSIDLSPRKLRWTVDTPEDLEFVRAVYQRLGTDTEFGLDEILTLLDKHPEMSQINASEVRNEGYYLSLAKEPPVPCAPLKLDRSKELLAKAERLIPTRAQTFSKAPTQFVQGASPSFIARGEGSHVWDVDGNEYIDFAMALGPIILGHNDPEVTEAVERQMRDGMVYSLPHPLELDVAETLTELIPCAEMVRFGKNGSDATSGAIRAARAMTGRDVVAVCGYHGWQDWYIATTTRNKGVPHAVRDLTKTFNYNDAASLEQILAEHPRQVAAIVMEPVGIVEPQAGFLEAVREMATKHGAILIYDEIVTGFRHALGGGQELYGVTPDLACFGKAMANGFPLAAVVGRRDIMQWFDEIFFSFTFGGEALSLAACQATIAKMSRENVIAHLWEQGTKLKDGYNVLAREFNVAHLTQCVGLPPRNVLTFKDETGADSLVVKSYVQQECLKRGLLFTGGQNTCHSHSDADMERTLRVYRTVLEMLADATAKGDVESLLEGKPVEAVFRKA